MRSITFKKSRHLSGSILVPGDKSISHRALILAACSVGRVQIKNLLESLDVQQTMEALKAMGISIHKKTNGTYVVNGLSTAGFMEPKKHLDMGNSGTSIRLLMGLVSSLPIKCMFVGDDSLSKRPMKRVIFPLKEIGADIEARKENFLPLSIIGAKNPMPINYKMSVPSAQVKSAILLSALNIDGITSIVESEKTRDHTELMMRYLGAKIKIINSKGKREIIMHGQPILKTKEIFIPGDISSAAFLLVAAIITPKSKIVIKNVGLNPLRMGFYKTLKEMGAKIKITEKKKIAGEVIGNIEARSSKLRGVKIPAKRAPSMIDEYPIISIAAACAKGKTLMRGLDELRLKESDRIKMIEKNLKKCGIIANVKFNKLEITGCANGTINGGTKIDPGSDHRIAMSFAILGLKTEKPISIINPKTINTSFPNFIKIIKKLRGEIK